MDIIFLSNKLKKICENDSLRVRKFGPVCSKRIKMFLDDVSDMPTLAGMRKLPQHRCHELTEDRKGQLGANAQHPKRIIFRPFHSPIPRKEDGGLDWDKVTAVEILEIEDYHPDGQQ